MSLSAEQFSAILDTLRSDVMCGRDCEQRVVPRVGLRVRATVTCRQGTGKAVQRQVWIRDISVGGLGLVASERIEKGSHFVIVFEGGHDKITIVYRVTRCGEAAKNQYIIGARFDRCIQANFNAKTKPVQALAKTWNR